MTRTFNGRAFRMKEHIDGFIARCVICVSIRYESQEMIDISEQIVDRNEHLRAAAGDWWIGQRVSRGVDQSLMKCRAHRSEVVWNARRFR